MSRTDRAGLAALATVVAMLVSAPDLRADDEVQLTPDIGGYLWLVESYMPTSPYGDLFATGALVEPDFFAGFADLDLDGVDELLVAVDHPVACDGAMCDLFTFSLATAKPNFVVPCSWNPADRSRVPIKRSLYERFVAVAGRTVVLTELSRPYDPRSDGSFDGLFDGKDWREYFAEAYDTPIEWGEVRLSDIRVGAYDLNGDGRDEVFIYAVSPSTCGRDECGGAILELLPAQDGAEPGWRWIGELNNLDYADNLIIGEDSSSFPARLIKVTDEVIDGYLSLCTRRSRLTWNGETYDISFGHGCAQD